MENKEKFEKLMQDEDFITNLLELQTPEEVQAEFKTNDVDLSLEEVNEVVHELDAIVGFVADEDLENVSGGNLTAQEKKDKFVGKFYEKLGDAAGNLVWIIPTVAVSTVVGTVIKFQIDRALEKKYPKSK